MMATSSGKAEVEKTPGDGAMRALRAQQINVAFAQVVTLMMRSQRFRHTFLAELEWLVAPAVATGQFLITEVKSAEAGFPAPVAAVLWASVSEAVDARLTASGGKPKLKPGEWVSGGIPWLIDAIGEPQAAGSLIKKLAEERFAQVGLKSVERQPDGKMLVRILGNPNSGKGPNSDNAKQN